MNILDRLPNFCPVPWQEMTIDPQGKILLCCQSTQGPLADLGDVDSLDRVFHGAEFQSIRDQFLAGGVPKTCASCIARNQQGIATVRTDRLRAIDQWQDRALLTRLEVDLSTLCNQRCVMCSSRYSSQWQNLDRSLPEKWSRQAWPTRERGAEDMQKILALIPQLEQLDVKGGEPTIDPRFEQILDSLGPDQHLRIVTNLQQPRPRVFEQLLARENLSLIISIDGHGELYDWVRRGDWHRTRTNLERVLAEARAEHVIVTMSLNYWTLPHLEATLAELEQIAIKSPRKLNITLRTVLHPRYTTAEAVKADELERARLAARATWRNIKITGQENLDNLQLKPELAAECEAWAQSLDSPKGGAQIS